MATSQNKILLALISSPVIFLALWYIAIWLFDGKIEYIPMVAFHSIFYSNTLGSGCLVLVGFELVVGAIILLLIPYEEINVGRYFKYTFCTLLLCFTSLALLLGADRIFNNDASQAYKNFQPKAVLSWDEDIYDYEDECIIVEGPVVSSTYSPESNSMPTFLDMGEEYPSDQRISIVIWGEFRKNFKEENIVPEEYYINKTVRVIGIVGDYDGIYQIEVTDPGQISTL